MILLQEAPMRPVFVQFRCAPGQTYEVARVIYDREVVSELFAERFSVAQIRDDLRSILPGGSRREAMLQGYDDVASRLGHTSAPDNAARIMVKLLKG